MRAAVADFLYHEAELLDAGAFVAWGALFAETCLYWMPVDPAQIRPHDGVSHVCDDRQMLDARIHRLIEPRFNQPEPLPRTLHLVGAVRVGAPEADGAVVATSATVVTEFRQRGLGQDDRRAFSGRLTHRLRPHGESWRIERKRVDLVDSAGSYNAIFVPL